MLNKLFCRGVFCELNFDGHEHIDKNIDMHDDAKTTTKLLNKPIPKRKCVLWCAFGFMSTMITFWNVKTLITHRMSAMR